MKNNFLKKARKFAFVILAGSIVTVGGCKKESSDETPTPTGPGTNEVWMQNSKFVPSTITISPNTTIKWINKDNMEHTVTSNSGVFESDTMTANTTFSYNFTAAGTYPYFCIFHSGMTGTVVVQ